MYSFQIKNMLAAGEAFDKPSAAKFACALQIEQPETENGKTR